MDKVRGFFLLGEKYYKNVFYIRRPKHYLTLLVLLKFEIFTCCIPYISFFFVFTENATIATNISNELYVHSLYMHFLILDLMISMVAFYLEVLTKELIIYYILSPGY